MKPQPPKHKPDVPVAVHCRCGNRIILEPRWIGKPTGCAHCGADFVVSMLVDPQTKRWVPHVQYTPTYVGDVKKTSNGEWINVACECGTKIGLDRRFIGRNMKCSGCRREFVVRMTPRTQNQGDTAVLQIREKKPTTRFPVPQSAPERQPSVMEQARAAPPPKKGGPSPPDLMHLLCTCGEELHVPHSFYNHNMYCAGCGALMHLRLEFDAARGKYELLARVLDQPREEQQA